jgi:hypothetical protein
MSDVEKFVAGLAAAQGPICDDCLTDLVGWGQRQRANAIGRSLLTQGDIIRGPGRCYRCGRQKTVSASESTARPAASPTHPAGIAAKLKTTSPVNPKPPSAAKPQPSSPVPPQGAMKIFDPRAYDYYFVRYHTGKPGIVAIAKKAVLPNDYLYAEKITYGEAKSALNAVRRAKQREEQARLRAKLARKRHRSNVFWLVFAFTARGAAKGFGRWIKAGS